ncbi:unnamed protein product [Calicophoron daubneyi]|uniref:ZSWIM3 N-terminal domain-containing protein n=1 Tax=Calicophoron daubneyi TaxID=300641 RepID=A0AAV2TW41_CALDB
MTPKRRKAEVSSVCAVASGAVSGGINADQPGEESVDITREFYNHFPRDATYQSFEAVESTLRSFQKSTGTSYVKRGSRTADEQLKRCGEFIPRRFMYKYVYFRCIHHRKDRTAPVWGRRFKDWGCPSVFKIVYEEGALHIQDGCSNLIMRHNHPLVPGAEWLYPNNRTRFTQEELGIIYGLMRTCKSSVQVREYIRVRFGVEMTADDFRRLRRKAKVACSSKWDLQPIQEPLPKDRDMEVDVDASASTCKNKEPGLGDTENEMKSDHKAKQATSSVNGESQETSKSTVLTEEEKVFKAREVTMELYEAAVTLEDASFVEAVTHIKAIADEMRDHGRIGVDSKRAVEFIPQLSVDNNEESQQ